jgi:GDP/UDP-N,N'-diacetylbacillosamine 2-epimerase (hydrolysing)
LKKKICIITGSRAEYGLLLPLLKLIKKDNFFNLQIIATGMHVSQEFGNTYQQIEKDGFTINAKVEMLLSSDTNIAITKSTGIGVMGMADALQQLTPDIVVVIADRFESFAATTAAYLMGIPIAHIHGGEVTEGAFDEGLRHSMTKMSYWHFVSTQKYKQRVIQLGEQPNRVFNVGAIGLDNIKDITLLSQAELEKQIDFSLAGKTAMVTFHPVTLEKNSAAQQCKNLMEALAKTKNLNYIFTKPNADTNGRIIAEMMDAFVDQHPQRAVCFTSMGQLRYLSALKYVDMMIGNSSSGIIEMPYFNKPTVNIGNRQKGRVMANSIIDCKPSTIDIQKAIEKAMVFNSKKIEKLYGNGTAATKIYTVLKKQSKINTAQKSFYDLAN